VLVRIVRSFAVASFLLAGLSLVSGQKVSLDQVPPPVKATIQKQLAGGQLLEIDKDDDEGEISFTVQFTNKAGAHRELMAGDDGTLLTLEIGVEEAPAEIQKTIRAQASQNKIKQIDKTFEDGEISYEVDFTRPDGTTRSFSVNSAGKLARVQIGLEDLPAEVRKTMDANLHGGKLAEAFKLIDDSEISFEGDVDHDGQMRDILVAPDGKLQSVELTMAEVTGPARKTIEEKVGNGKILRVEKTTEQRQGVMPYEIEARKDGKTIRFSVGPRGRFLGMND
jgi:uncharacterized membrane protein YkoI